MINIARFIPFFAGQCGGALNHILELSYHLGKYPIKNIVYTSSEIDYHATQRTQLYQELTPKFIVKRFNSHLKFRDYRVSFKLFPTLFKDSKKINIFHSHALRSFQEDIGAIVAIIRKKKFVITTHGALCTNMNYYEHLIKRLYDTSDSFLKNKLLDIDFIAVSKLETEFLRKYRVPEEKIHYIPHGINVNHFKPVDPSDFLKTHNLEGKKIILYVGRITQRKGIDVLIKAFSLVKEEIPDAYLLIAGGDYGYKSTIEKISRKQNFEKSIKFLGFIPKRQLPMVYSAADLVAYPSKFEIFGHVVLESNACGKVIIASRHWGPKEIVDEGKTGYLTKYGDVEELREKIVYVLENEKRHIEMGKYAREHVKKNYSWDACAKSHYNLYKKILNK